MKLKSFIHVKIIQYKFVPLTSLTPSFFYIKIPVPSLECERSCICMLVVSILPRYYNFFLFGFGTVLTGLYFCTSFWKMVCYKASSTFNNQTLNDRISKFCYNAEKIYFQLSSPSIMLTS